MRKKIGIGIIVVLLFIMSFGSMEGLSLSEAGTLPDNLKIVRSSDTSKGKAVLVEDENNHSFGVVDLEQSLNILYRSSGASTGNTIERGAPFKATGIGDMEDFLVGIKTSPESNIQYIAIGNHTRELNKMVPSDTYSLHLDDVRANMDKYHLEEVIDNYALFTFDEYNKDNWSIRAFDKEGNLVADMLFGGQPRYTNW